MSLYFHGTVVGGLTELKPFASPFSNLKYACVYLSTNEALASIYIWNKQYKWMTFVIEKDGTPLYTESFPNSLKEFYDGVKGYIYTCEGDYSTENDTGIKHAAVSEKYVPIINCKIVDNAYEQILQLKKEGKLIIRHFEELSQEEHNSNRKMVLSAIKRLNLLDGTHPLLEFVQEKYMDLWKESKDDANVNHTK